jgi:RNA polymerase primary sigma factor
MKNLSHTLLSHKDEIELFKAYEVIETRQEAYEKLILHNQRLVMSIASRYKNVALDDAFQDGNLGLIQGIKRFDYRRGTRFSTYATWWIRQSINRAIASRGHTIRLPAYKYDLLIKALAIKNRIKIESGQEPSLKILAEYVGVKESVLVEILEKGQNTISLDAPDHEDWNGDSSLYDSFPAHDKEADPYFKKQIQDAFLSLSPREQKIIELRFGFDADGPMTLREIANKFGLTRERIRQLEAKALVKLKEKL